MEIEQEPIQPLPDPPTPAEVAATAPDYTLHEYDAATGIATFTRNWYSGTGQEVIPTPDWLARRADKVINAALVLGAGSGGLVLVYFFARPILLICTLAFLAYAFFVGIAGGMVELHEYAQSKPATPAPAGEQEEETEYDGHYTNGEDVIEEKTAAYVDQVEMERLDREKRLAAYLEKKKGLKRSGRDEINLEINHTRK